MIVIASALLGIFLGVRSARARNGSTLDLLQYAAGYGIAFTLLGVLLTLVAERLFT